MSYIFMPPRICSLTPSIDAPGKAIVFAPALPASVVVVAAPELTEPALAPILLVVPLVPDEVALCDPVPPAAPVLPCGVEDLQPTSSARVTSTARSR
jgi:hypothetical protein